MKKVLVKERLAELIKVLAIKQSQFAKTIEVQPASVSEWLNKPNSNPTLDSLIRISICYNVNLNWLITGAGTMFNVPAHARPPDSDIPSRSLVKIPLVADIAAGTGIEAYDAEPRQILTIDQSLLNLPGPYWAFRVEGDSMEPTLTTDDIAIITRSWYEIDYNGMICAFRNDNGLLIKRVYIAPKAKFGLLIPLNPKHQITQYDRNSPDIIMLGILVASFRLHNQPIKEDK